MGTCTPRLRLSGGRSEERYPSHLGQWQLQPAQTTRDDGMCSPDTRRRWRQAWATIRVPDRWRLLR